MFNTAMSGVTSSRPVVVFAFPCFSVVSYCYCLCSVFVSMSFLDCVVLFFALFAGLVYGLLLESMVVVISLFLLFVPCRSPSVRVFLVFF